MISRIFLLAITCLAACQSKPVATKPVRDLKEDERLHKAGLVLIPDLEHAKAWEELIHKHIGVSAQKIQVEAGAGFTTITIRELKNRADAESVAQGFRDMAAKNPEKFGITKVEVSLNNVPTTINPFVLPSAANPGTVNPGAVLPTLSLPPLRLDGR